MYETRQCKACLKVLPLEDFYFADKTKTTRLHKCKACKIQQRKASPSYTKPSSNGHVATNRRREFIRRYKSLCGCKICGEKQSVCLDLHHLDPSQKEFEPAKMGRQSMEKIRAELKKCVVLCANHHRMVHAGLIEL